MMKSFGTMIGVVGTGALLVACGNVSGPSMAPVGDGLRFLGICAVIAVLVVVLSPSKRGGDPHE